MEDTHSQFIISIRDLEVPVCHENLQLMYCTPFLLLSAFNFMRKGILPQAVISVKGPSAPLFPQVSLNTLWWAAIPSAKQHAFTEHVCPQQSARGSKRQLRVTKSVSAFQSAL